jgi:CBS domain containing-hemolysin-like protein
MELLLVAGAIVLQALFAGTETALVRSNWIRLATWADEHRFGARAARHLLDRREVAVITTLAATNLFIIVSSSLAERFTLHALGPGYTPASVLVVTVLALYFAQFLPKSAAQLFPERWLCWTEAPLRLAEKALWPLTWLLVRVSGARGSDQFTISRRDFVFALRASARSGGTSPRLSGIAARVLDFPDVKTGDVMTPLDRVEAVPDGITYAELRALIRQNRFTRYPVFRGARQNIVGVQNVRDLLEMPRRIIRKPFFVSARSRAIEVMNLMRVQGEHMAFVRDDAEQVLGIVTLEDLLEELVGEIRSEE